MSDSSDIPDSNWTKEKLVWPHDAASLEAKKKEDPTLWGRPGYLTEDQADAFFKFKEVVESRGGDFKDTVYTFGIEEGEVYALTRWLRARKFVFDDVMKMVEEASKVMAEPKANNFYIDPSEALGCPQAVYDAQYPQVYSGFAKNGSPVFFSKVGVVNITAVECISTIPDIVKYHWYVQIHDFGKRLRAKKKEDPNFTRFECLSILDCNNLTMAQLTSYVMRLIKEQTVVDSLCFPETMNKMFIINSPRFFSATWSIIKGWLDPRTANKINVMSGRKTWEKELLEYIDADQLPADYGGTGPLSDDTMEKEGFTGTLKRLHTEVLYVRSSGSATFNVQPGEEVEITVYTRSLTGAKFLVSDANSNQVFVKDVALKHDNNDIEKPPSNVCLTKTRIKGPASVKMKAETMGSRFVASSSAYLVTFSVH
mmetsp:Transcript_21874/g.52047  ORF Transcript_21874/g.52047 Transcript_21874/m.52047 type:complete len:425 (+) Transcript_21874:295-1569(+)|eukprot:CAMPEP_0197184020 /NCGR_PEP_ID=MMETSP1423-20130617/9015_1 /TAXON_ID=476441 /ORGANISM="Pseudo-nitzschia heimii, Strain UNC1101" /LENGTH=424 /DNA_ID=CAMNT_0042634731 /DNA_START=255 /DNA_END=1529 /DNA_ORIENTATION=+